jgi:hypothetical protein
MMPINTVKQELYRATVGVKDCKGLLEWLDNV